MRMMTPHSPAGRSHPDRCPRTVEVEPAPEPFDPTEPPPAWIPRAGRRGLRSKLAAALRGLKYAARGDSSFFAHGYRFLLCVLVAAHLGVDPLGWCLMILSFTLVLMAELTHSAVDTLARATGDPESPDLKGAREIAAGGVLVAVVTWAGTSSVVLVLKFGDMLGWWG